MATGIYDKAKNQSFLHFDYFVSRHTMSVARCLVWGILAETGCWPDCMADSHSVANAAAICFSLLVLYTPFCVAIQIVVY